MHTDIYKHLIDASSIPYGHFQLLRDATGNAIDILLIDLNAAATTLLAIDKEIFIGHSFATYLNAAHLDQHVPLHELYQMTQFSLPKRLYLSLEIHRLDQDTFHIFILNVRPEVPRLSPILQKSLGASIPLTDPIKLQESLIEKEETFIELANNLNELIIICTEKNALYISPYFEQLYGFKPDALYEDISVWYDYWDTIEFKDGDMNYHCREISTCTFHIIKNGLIDKWIYGKFVPIIDASGCLIRKIGFLRDVTEKKELDDALDALRFEFFANLSHEFRTPINLIMSALQMTQITAKEHGHTELNKYLHIINQNTLRLIKLVDNLIDTTKINSGNFDYSPRNTELIGFVENICMSVADFVARNQLTIIFDTDVEEKTLAFDPNHMERILLNLISNAIKFNQENGQIEVTITTTDQVQICVKDTGIGIPQEKLESVFGRFEQVHRKLKKGCEGSGIGLSLVKSLVEMHGGTITLDSTPGTGSTFTITLPDILLPEEEATLDAPEEPIVFTQVIKMAIEFSDIYTCR